MTLDYKQVLPNTMGFKNLAGNICTILEEIIEKAFKIMFQMFKMHINA